MHVLSEKNQYLWKTLQGWGRGQGSGRLWIWDNSIYFFLKAAGAAGSSSEAFLAFLRKTLAGAVCAYTAWPPRVKAPVIKSSMLNSLDLIRRGESFEENQV